MFSSPPPSRRGRKRKRNVVTPESKEQTTVVTSENFFETLPNTDDIRKEIDKRYNNLTHKRSDGKCVPYVCAICDEFIIRERDYVGLNPKELQKPEIRKLFEWKNYDDPDRPPEIEEAFTLPNGTEPNENFDGMCLSPRACIRLRNSDHWNSCNLVTCCRRCHTKITREKKLPFYSIINYNYVGCVPACIAELTDIELCYLTPVKCHGFVMSFFGGAQLCLRGIMTMMRVSERSIANATLQLEAVGLKDNVIVLANGNMTPGQYTTVKEKYVKVNTGGLLRALDWMVYKNKEWKKLNLEEMRQRMRAAKPVFIDQSSRCPSVNANVEKEEVFTCYYPDGAMDENNGGFDQPDAFRAFVESMKEQNYDVEFTCNLEKEFVTGNGEDLQSACLLQFPYGICGWDQKRLSKKMDGSRTNNVDTAEFCAHLSKLSQKDFHRPLFMLILFSLMCKQQILRTSRFQLRGEQTAKALADGLNVTDLQRTAILRGNGHRQGGTLASRTLLNACDATARSLPHTNDAAKKARARAEALQHHFGIGSVWLTVSFDDKNSYLCKIMSGIQVEDGKSVTELTDQECRDRCTKRDQIRLKYPGIAALNYEMLLDIVFEVVIGWDRHMKRPTEKPGYFGIPEALSMAAEEQKRKTIHSHFTIWIKGYRGVQKKLFFGGKDDKRKAKKTMLDYNQRIASTTMINEPHRILKKAFSHKCSVAPDKMPLPQVVCDQKLRELRHKCGYAYHGGEFAYCEQCGQTWTNEELLAAYLVKVKGIHEPGLNLAEWSSVKQDIPMPRLFCQVVEYQASETAAVPNTAIDAAYNHHSSSHAKSCFKCSGKKGHTCTSACECRYRLPDKSRKNSSIRDVGQNNVWYTWRGESKNQPIVEFQPQRNKYDLFQNVSCPAISHSKLACNSNVALITDGPVSQYQFKYHIKPTQKEEAQEYAEAQASIKKLEGRKWEKDEAEALRRISRACFAHNQKNVIAASLASYLIRNKERFYFSHEFVYCPLNDLVKLQKGEKIDAQLKFGTGNQFFENMALHYLCRPVALETCNVKKFFEEYEFVKLNSKNRDDEDILEFIPDTGHFQHPAYNKKNKKWEQGVRKMAKKKLIQISHYAFPDTAKFKDDLLQCPDNKRTPAMEQYARTVLTLLFPHRTVDDLQHGIDQYPFLQKFRAVFDEETNGTDDRKMTFTGDNIQFLQNIQDCARNSTRYKVKSDELQQCTHPFCHEEIPVETVDEESEEEDEECVFDNLMETHFGEAAPDPNDRDPSFLPASLHNFSFEKQRDKGINNIGYTSDLNVPSSDNSNESVIAPNSERYNTTEPDPQDTNPEERIKYRAKDIVRIVFRRTQLRERPGVFKNVKTGERQPKVPEATGSIESIRAWAKAAKLDKIQKRAFESIMAAFILTFHEEPEEDEESTLREKLRRAISKKNLKRLRGTGDDALICLLHGPGGSGKSTVIELTIEYAKEFCKLLNHPFTSRTIVVTAMSGVAATLLLGETTHKALSLCRKGNLAEEEICLFRDARLLIIDEVSFANKSDFEHIDDTLRDLKQKRFENYGGMNVVLAGDYSQMEPIVGETIYTGEEVPAFHSMINSYVELDGMWRFQDDLEWGHINMRFRIGEPTKEDIIRINAECLVENREDEMVPEQTPVACFTNKERDAVNSAMFEEYCEKNRPADGSILKSACLVFMDSLAMKDNTTNYTAVESNAFKRMFYETAGEDDCVCGSKKSQSKGRVDPVLKLYESCPLMFTENTDVLGGQANGSRTKFNRLYMKAGEQPFVVTLKNGTKVNALLASQVECINVRHENPKIKPECFDVRPKQHSFSVELDFGFDKETVNMKGLQIPMISNSATTGHKLQGCTLDNLLVNDWHYGKNWAYVVLSRVRKMKGLWLRKALSLDLSKYKMKDAMKRMLRKFAEEKTIPNIDEEEYAAMIEEEANAASV